MTTPTQPAGDWLANARLADLLNLAVPVAKQRPAHGDEPAAASEGEPRHVCDGELER